MLSVQYIALILASDRSLAGEAFVTLATTDSYCMGATVVAKSLRHHGTARSIVVMVTPNVSEQSRWVKHPFSLTCPKSAVCVGCLVCHSLDPAVHSDAGKQHFNISFLEF